MSFVFLLRPELVLPISLAFKECVICDVKNELLISLHALSPARILGDKGHQPLST